MVDTLLQHGTAHLVDPAQIETLSVLGPTIQVLTPPLEHDHAPCLMRGTIPPGVTIPLHAHADPETFIVDSGEVEGLTFADGNGAWLRVRTGEIVYVPGGARHAWRNRTTQPVVKFIVSTSKMARFFRELGVPVRPGVTPAPPSPQVLRHFQETSARYGYWNASPEENAEVGISLTPS